MKKTSLLICLAAVLLSCAKEAINPQEENTRNEGVPMTFNLTVLETKAAKTDWADGDKIYVFFNGLATKYLTLTYDGSSWSNHAGTLLSTDFDGLKTKTLTAVHFPVAVDVACADGKFTFTSGGKPVYTYYLFETGKDYRVDGTTVTATLSLGKPADMVQIHVAGIQANVSDYTFGCTKIRPVACASVDADGLITESKLQAGARLSGFADADGGIFAGRLEFPGVQKDYKFTLASDEKIYTLTRSGRALTPGTMYTFPDLSTIGENYWSVTNASDLYVDLGLSVKWAKYNVGADNETDYGDYFAWGELQPKNYYNRDFSTYLWGVPGDFIKYIGYTGSDYTVLQKEDDAAYADLGGKFRMPTRAEIKELLATKDNRTDYTWVKCDGEFEKYQDSTVKGWKVIKNVSGATIFFPCAGGMADFRLVSAGSIGKYWSSSLYVDAPYCAWGVDFYYNENIGDFDECGAERCIGRSVRPVSD